MTNLNYKDNSDFNFTLGQVRESISKAEIGKGLVDIKGKTYSTVGLRLNKLREHFGVGISIVNKIIENSEDVYEVITIKDDKNNDISKKTIKSYGKVVIEARIYLNTENGRMLLANGFAEKKRSLNFITKTSCVEFCQTTAIGRACAGLGILGDHNIASAEEMYGAKDDSVPDKIINNKPKVEVLKK